MEWMAGDNAEIGGRDDGPSFPLCGFRGWVI